MTRRRSRGRKIMVSTRNPRTTRRCAGARGRALSPMHAYMPLHSVHLRALARNVAGAQRRRSHPAGADARCGRRAGARRRRQTEDDQGEHVARSAQASRADDVGAGLADADPRSPDLRGRVDRAQERDSVQPLSPADDRARRRGQGDALARPRPQSIWRRRRAHRQLARPPGAAPAGEDQPRAGARRRAGHRQGHAARAGQARGRAVELRRGLAAADARPLQRLPEVGDPARQRGARPRRRQPLPVLRPHEGLHRRAARRAARRREEPARTQRAQLSAASSSPPTTRPTASTCRPTIAATSSPGPTSPRTTSPTTTGTSCGAGTTAAAIATSPPISPSSTSRPSTPRRRRRRPPPSGTSSTPTARPKTPNSPTCSNDIGNPDATTITQHRATTPSASFEVWIRDRKNRRAIPHRLEKCGYVPVRNDAAKDGYVEDQRHAPAVYAKSTLSTRDRIKPPRASPTNDRPPVRCRSCR